MRKLLTVILFTILILTLFVCNTKAQGTKQDSLKRESVRQAHFIDSIENRMPFKSFIEWCYENLNAKKYDEFKQLYQTFLQQKYHEFIKPKK